jgi:hypothetical protein
VQATAVLEVEKMTVTLLHTSSCVNKPDHKSLANLGRLHSKFHFFLFEKNLGIMHPEVIAIPPFSKYIKTLKGQRFKIKER